MNILKVILAIVKWFLIVAGIIAVALFIYWYPVIDRLYVRPCYYYPKAFADCN